MLSNLFVLESLDGFLDAIPFIQPSRKRADWTLNREKNLGDKSPMDFLPLIHLPTGFHKAVFRQASWGFLHPGIANRREQPKHIHAQVEQLFEQQPLQHALYQPSERCLIPVSGFYAEGTEHRIRPRVTSGFLLAGLMSPWGRILETIHTFAMITTPASEEFSPFGKRMPAILSMGAAWKWLTERDPVKALNLIQPASDDMFRMEEDSLLDEPESGLSRIGISRRA